MKGTLEENLIYIFYFPIFQIFKPPVTDIVPEESVRAPCGLNRFVDVKKLEWKWADPW